MISKIEDIKIIFKWEDGSKTLKSSFREYINRCIREGLYTGSMIRRNSYGESVKGTWRLK